MKVMIHDFETAGGPARRCGVVQLALLGGDLGTHGVFIEQWRSNHHYHPGVAIDPATTRVHGLTDADVADCPDYRRAIPAVYREAAQRGFDALTIGFGNSGFDNVIAARLGYRPRDVLDLAIPARRLKMGDGLASGSLGSTFQELTGKAPTGAHDALFDVQMTAALLPGLMARFGFHDVTAFIDWATTGQPLPGLKLRFGPWRGSRVEALDDDSLRQLVQRKTGDIDLKASLTAEYEYRGLAPLPAQGQLFQGGHD
ncbi:3'-5' exonuclease [Kushneria aurantia]|uniref:Exonuclease domain-containing protein n=1 Tax=Kushneria aurantia TaxID=504092 RepID=A0ABV6G052_9GAMM|nr:3'-5' exonuclease [Kushneria aurantia]